MDMISPSIAALTPSLTLKVTNRAKAMKASGEEVYGLAGGEPEMDTPENIKQAAIAALNNGATKYTPSAGLPALRQAIAEKLKRENNLEYDFTQITVGAGAKHACFNAIMATVSEGMKSSSPPRTGSAIRKWSACAEASPSSWKPRRKTDGSLPPNNLRKP